MAGGTVAGWLGEPGKTMGWENNREIVTQGGGPVPGEPGGATNRPLSLEKE